MKSKYVVLFVEASDPKFQFDATADGGAAVREPGPGSAGPPRGMAWQEELRMEPRGGPRF